MIPVVKGWLTETANEVAYLGVQVHGGMGFIEETGAAQFMRDARITTIYEGTTGIQANDLIGRKIAREGGKTVRWLISQMRQTEAALHAAGGTLVPLAETLGQGIGALEDGVSFLLEHYDQEIAAVSVGAVPFLRLMGIVCGGWQMSRAALVAQGRVSAGDDPASFHAAKLATARFYADHVLVQARGLAQTLLQGGAAALAIDEGLL